MVFLVSRCHPLAHPPLPIRHKLRRRPLGSLPTSQRDLCRYDRRGSPAGVIDLGARLPSYAVAAAVERSIGGEELRDWVLAAYAVPGGGLLAESAGAEGLVEGTAGE